MLQIDRYRYTILVVMYKYKNLVVTENQTRTSLNLVCCSESLVQLVHVRFEFYLLSGNKRLTNINVMYF